MRVEKAAVLGAGTMGAQIAAHLAMPGCRHCCSISRRAKLTPEEQAKGLTSRVRRCEIGSRAAVSKLR